MKQACCRWFGIVSIATVALGIAACSNDRSESSEEAAERASSDAASEQASPEGTTEARSEGSGEHGEGGEGEGGEGEGEHGAAGHDEEGEESGVYIGRGETWDVVRRGARLVLKFAAASNAFVGTVENTTEGTLCAVRVEVHLSTGTELGPTPRTDVAPGQKTAVTLETEGEAFDTWTAHAELSACSGG